MPVWISTVNAIPDLGNGPFKNYKGVIVNAITHAPDREIAIKNIVQGLREYRLQIESIDDLDIFHNNKSLPTKSLSKLAAKSQKHFTTEFDIFYTYDE